MLIYRWFCSEIHYSGRSDAQFDTYGKAVEGSGGCLLQQIFTKEEEVSPRKDQAAATRVSIDVRQKCEVFSVF